MALTPLDSYRERHRIGREQLAAQSVQWVPGTDKSARWRRDVFGMRWWIALALLACGMAIGNLVVPYVDERPKLVEPVADARETPEKAVTPEPAICRNDGGGGPLYEAFPLCP